MGWGRTGSDGAEAAIVVGVLPSRGVVGVVDVVEAVADDALQLTDGRDEEEGEHGCVERSFGCLAARPEVDVLQGAEKPGAVVDVCDVVLDGPVSGS